MSKQDNQYTMPDHVITDAWMASGLGQAMTPTDVDALLATSIYKIDHLQKGDIYAICGDLIADLRIVIRGTLHAEMVGYSGKQILMDTLGVGRILAPALLFAQNNRLAVTLIADEDTEILRMSKTHFRQLMHQYPQLMDNFLQILSDISTFLIRKISLLNLKSLQGKIADFLMLTYRQQPTDNVIKISVAWKELANRFGVNRQSLARALAQMEQEGLLSVKGKAITLLQPNKLSNIH